MIYCHIVARNEGVNEIKIESFKWREIDSNPQLLSL